MNYEKEIDRHIINWEKYKLSHSGPIKQVRQTYMAETKKKRRLSLPKDLYLSICKFLNMADMIKLTTLCKEFIEYYPYIWGVIQNNIFKKSLIPETDYVTIRNSISIKIYTDVLHYNNWHTSNSWKEIEEDDRLIKQRSNDLLQLKNTYPGYEGCIYAKNTHLGEICAMKKTRETSYKKLLPSVKSLINVFKWCSNTDFTKEKYLTIKPNIDMRLFGFDPETVYGKKCAIDCYKWLTYKYNEYYDYDYDRYERKDYDTYMYEYSNEDGHYRYRKRPSWYYDVFISEL